MKKSIYFKSVLVVIVFVCFIFILSCKKSEITNKNQKKYSEISDIAYIRMAELNHYLDGE